jgi:hypothetical protein
MSDWRHENSDAITSAATEQAKELLYNGWTYKGNETRAAYIGSN